VENYKANETRIMRVSFKGFGDAGYRHPVPTNPCLSIHKVLLYFILQRVLEETNLISLPVRLDFRLINSEQKPLSLFRFIHNPQSLLNRYCFMSLVLRQRRQSLYCRLFFISIFTRPRIHPRLEA
jgi:hypothetical protein